MSYLWTSEAVAAGHPDKTADQIADAVLDLHLAYDPQARVACEVTLCSDLVLVTGEITIDDKKVPWWPDDNTCEPVISRRIERLAGLKQQVEERVREVLKGIGYDRAANAYDGGTIEILNKIKGQSPEISKAVTGSGQELGAGDQGIMFGYATNEYIGVERAYVPFTHALSFEIIDLIENDIRKGRVGDDWLSPFLPDAKSQVTALYDSNGHVVGVDTVLVSACHRSDVSLADLQHYLWERVQKPLQERPGLTHLFNKTKWLFNPAGTWNVGGPASDTGLSGRKIVVDNYGADCPVGGGSFSGKDPTKVDRSAAYAARHLAKNIVAAGLAKKCQVQLSYAIGVAQPISTRVQTFGTCSGQTNERELAEMIAEVPLTPRAIIDRFGLQRPIYQATASGGHFGRPKFPWEQLDLAEQFREFVKF
jgi:S-adenosylmethionine synthetase